MKNTGYISNRGRQIVASYLTKDLNIDWRLGALYFQSMLIDYDPALNWEIGIIRRGRVRPQRR